ncbi:unnamed protein product [Ectocarpus sp. 4 AP-2014]
MRFSKLVLLPMLSVGVATAQQCSNGFPGIEKSGACCVSDCGTCGGSGCSSREPGLTGDDCCTKNILKQGAPCSATGHAPCFLDAGDLNPSKSTPTESDGFVYEGCFNDRHEPDRLFSYVTTTDDMTTELCANECKGFAFFGLQWGRECWCGTSDDYDKHGRVEDDSCDFQCSGDAEEICGGFYKMQTYAFEGSSSPSPPPPSSTAGGAFTCDGILKGDVCCSAGCGTCGGTGCSQRPGLTESDCCIGKIEESGPLCSVTGKAPCFVDGDSPVPKQTSPVPSPTPKTSPSPTPPSATPTPPAPVPSGCDKKATVQIDKDTAYFKSGGCATLTDLYNAQDGKGPLWVLDSNDNKVDGAGGSAKPTGRWLLTSNLKIEDDATLFVEGTGRGGDCDVLRIESTGSKYWEMFGHGGNMYFEGTKVTSWDTSKGQEREYKKNEGRSFIRCITQYDDNYSCSGGSNKDMGTCRMASFDIIDSTMGNMGYDASESYGLTWKVRGLCKDLSNLKLFDTRNVYGDIKNSDIYGMYYGMYSYGHEGGVWTNNKMHDNVQYGFDPHDDSDNLVIAHNVVYNNGNHGIIASKRCNNVEIYDNEVYGGGQAGIFLHRSSDNAKVYDNYIHDNDDAGIAFLESFDADIYDNRIVNCKYGIRLSLGSGDNDITNNTFDDISKYGLYTYKGSDSPDVSNGRPKGNKFEGNTVSNTKVGVLGKEGDDNIFKNNVFINVDTFEFEKSKGTEWTGNSLGGGCLDRGKDFTKGSDNIPDC